MREVTRMEERRKLLADNAMTTLEDLMEFMGMDPKDIGIPDSVKNNLERLINAASGYIERMTDRRFGRKEYIEGVDRSFRQSLTLFLILGKSECCTGMGGGRTGHF